MSQQQPWQQGPTHPAQQSTGAPQPYLGSRNPTPPAPGQPWQAAPYGQPGGYGVPGAPYAPYAVPPRHSPLMGAIGFGGVLVATIAFSWAMALFGAWMGRLAVEQGTSSVNTNPGALSAAQYAAMERLSVGVGLGCLLGLAAWVVCIVATVQRRGRGWGIAGIVLGVLALFIGTGAMAMGMLPYLQQLP